MATLTSAGTPLASTTNASAYTSSAFTPAAGDLLIALLTISGNTTGHVTDTQNLGWDLVASVLSASSVNTTYVFISQRFAAASSMTITFTSTSGAGSGSIMGVVRCSGMTRAGANAVRQSAKQANAAIGTPAPVFGEAPLTTNPIVGAIANGTSPATMTAPTTWTEFADLGYATPTTGQETVGINSGFTSTTVTWGSSSATVFGSIVVELDTTSVLPILTPTEYDGMGMGGSENPGFDTLKTQGFLSNMIAESNLGDNVELPPPVLAAKDTILMGYKGYWISRTAMVDPNDIIELIAAPPPPAPIVGYDADFDSRYWSDYFKDHLSDEGVELITLNPVITVPDMDWTSDSEQQFLHPGYIKDHLMDEWIDRIPFTLIIVPTMDWDNDDDRQYQMLGYSLDKDLLDSGVELVQTAVVLITVLDEPDQYVINVPWLMYNISDEGVELIQIPIEAYDNDSDQQRQQDGYSIDRELSDNATELITLFQHTWDDTSESQVGAFGYSLDRELSDTGVENIIIPVMEIDSDQEQQISNPGYSTDKSLSDETVERITIPILGYDTDGDLQLAIPPYTTDRDQSDSNVELVQIPTTEIDNDADYQRLMPLMFSSDTLSDETVEKITLNPIVSNDTWDDHAENSIPFPVYYKDHLSDESTEEIFIPIQAYDTDADQQKLSEWRFASDTVSDEVVELVQIADIQAWDTDADNQRPNPLMFSMDTVVDEFEELPIPPPIVTSDTWDDVSEQSFQHLGYFKDHLSDESVEKITIPVQAYDSDTDSNYQLGYTVDRDVLDANIELVTIPTQTLDDLAVMQRYTPPYSFYSDVVDENLELLPVQVILDYTWDDYAEQSRQWLGYDTDRSTSDEGTERIFIPVQAYDTDADNQISNPAFTIDKEQSDNTVELVQIPVREIDNDADSQMQMLGYNTDKDVVDSQVELIQIPTMELDNDAEQSFQQSGYTTDRDLLDTGVEFITVPVSYDNDADFQLPFKPWYIDTEDEKEGVPLIILQGLRNWDQDIYSDIPWIPYSIDTWTDKDLYQEIFPIVFVVPVVFEIKNTLRCLIDQITCTNRVLVQTMKNDLRLNLDSIQASNRIGIQEIANSFRVNATSITNTVLR